MKKLLTICLTFAMTAALFAGCTAAPKDNDLDASQTAPNGTSLSGMVNISGSTSVESLSKAFGEAFGIANPDVQVDVQGGGSGAAVTDVENGVSDIGTLSRALKDTEKEKGFTETVIAKDGIAVIVNSGNTVTDLTSEQLAKIFTGEITNWSEVGSDAGEIVVVGREAGSGTRDGFEELVGVKEKCKYSTELNETGQVKAQVAQTKGAIGYMSLGYVDESVKAVTVDTIVPTEASVKDGSYKLQRPFIMITKDSGKPQVQAFLEFVLSAGGQEIVTSKGYVTVL